jgi:hypothetical protein
MNTLMSWLVKLIFILMLLPFAVSFLLQLIASTLQAVLTVFAAALPWLIGSAVLIAVVAGLIAGSRLAGRLPPRSGSYLRVEGMTAAIKRPRGRRSGDQ